MKLATLTLAAANRVAILATAALVVMPAAAQSKNPYAFENMVCDEFLIEPDTNPYYPGGVCADPAINLSAVVPDTCIDDGDEVEINFKTGEIRDKTKGIVLKVKPLPKFMEKIVEKGGLVNFLRSDGYDNI